MRASRTARCIAGLALGCASVLTAAGSAQASSADPSAQTGPQARAQAASVINTFRNQLTGECLDDSNSYGLRTTACNGGTWQQWDVHVWGDGTRELQNRATGQCLDDSNSYGLRTVRCNESQYQSWYVHHWGDGTIRFRNQLTGRCLDDSNSYGLRTYACNSSQYQSWY